MGKVQEYELAEANRALVELKRGATRGAKVPRASGPFRTELSLDSPLAA
jgi:hypothetical protein